jgi:hypothetical protein
MGVAPLGRTVLVPVANPASVRPLLTLAAEIARADDGIVEVVTVLGPDMPASVHADAWSQLAEAERLSAGVPVRGRVVHAEDAPTGVFEAVEQTGATLTLMGWRGRSSASDVFSRLIDRLVGRSKVPLAILRPGTQEPRRMLLPISADHLLTGGETGLAVAAGLAARLRASCPEPTTILRTGARDTPLPDDITRLGDRVHHDPRRTHQAVGAFAQPDDLIVAAVAPTVSGLRAATTHLAWSAPDATLLIAVDAGPPVSIDLTDAVDGAGRQPPTPTDPGDTLVRITVTVDPADEREVPPAVLEGVLQRVGVTDQVMAWWPTGGGMPNVCATVTVRAAGVNRALALVAEVVRDAPELEGAEISYDVERRLRSTRTSALTGRDSSRAR